MKPHASLRQPRLLPIVPLLLLPWAVLTGQTVPNPGFDENTFTAFPGYASGNGGVINGWTLLPPERTGLNPSGGSPFANNGATPSAPNVAFIQAGASGPASMKTTVTGLTIGTKYNVSVRLNCRAGYQSPFLQFSTDGDGPSVLAEVTSVAGGNDFGPAYRYGAYEFTATAASHEITFANLRTDGDATLLLDNVTIAPSTGAWSVAPWTNDADSGIDPQYVYTHAYSFGSNPPVTINGVPFIGREVNVPGRFSITDLPNSFGNLTPNNVTGDGANLAKDFRYGGANTGITLHNLKPSTQYVFTHYGIGFDAAPTSRTSTFVSSLGGDRYTSNLNRYGQSNGILTNYTYSTDALGSPVTISFPALSANSYHTSGFSNREAAPSTPPVRWTVAAWDDDATSGVSPNHHYTHAFKFGAATNFNLNGINFTGLAGANPGGANYLSTSLPNVYNNDINTVTGYGSPLARDFVYNGFPALHTLTGLTPGKSYVLTIYSVGWNDGARPAAFIGGVGEGATVLNQDQFGNDRGLRFDYAYTADATGTLNLTVSGFDGTRSIHHYGLSNREADPLVGTKPVITLQPVGAAIGFGSDFTLRAAGIGSPTLQYQWQLDGEDIPGADEPVLLLENIGFDDAGDYTLTITNNDGNATSNPATVIVRDNVAGFFASGLGVDGQPLPNGSIDPHYTLLTNPDNTESETVFVQSNVPGAWLPNSTTSKWVGPRADTAAAAALTADDGEGPGNYVYRTRIDLTNFDLPTVRITGSWTSDNVGLAIRVNGVATGLVNTGNFAALTPFTIDTTVAPGLVAGVNTIDFLVNNADAATGFTGLRVDGLAAVGTIPPNTAPHIVTQPAGVAGPHNGTVALAVAATGSHPLGYKWFKGTEEIVGAVEPVLYVDILDLTAAGNYSVRVSNGAGFVDSQAAAVTIPNAVPVVVDDDLTTDQGVPLEIDVVFDMLANDTDGDNDLLTLAGFAAASFNGGTVTEAAGIITYTPAPGYHGLDGFTYTVSDGWGGTSAPGTVLIDVKQVVDPAPQQLTITLAPGGATATAAFKGAPGVSYTLQRSPDLTPLSWVDIGTEIAPLSGDVLILDDDPLPVRAFYRISYTP